MSFLKNYDAQWRRTHIFAHVFGGIVWSLILCLPPLQLTVWQRVMWVGIIQGVWERYQREYDPTYPLWSGAADTLLAVVGAILFGIGLVLFQ